MFKIFNEADIAYMQRTMRFHFPKGVRSDFKGREDAITLLKSCVWMLQVVIDLKGLSARVALDDFDPQARFIFVTIFVEGRTTDKIKLRVTRNYIFIESDSLWLQWQDAPTDLLLRFMGRVERAISGDAEEPEEILSDEEAMARFMANIDITRSRGTYLLPRVTSDDITNES